MPATAPPPFAQPHRNPFAEAVPWDPRPARPSLFPEQVERAITHRGLERRDPEVYRCICTYAFGEAEAWPSQQRVADDLGCCRETVNRAVRRLIRAGWLRIVEKRFSRGAVYCHNVYELMAEWVPVGNDTVRRIVRRAHRARSRFQSQDHTKGSGGTLRRLGGPSMCSCRWCRPARSARQRADQPPPPITALGRRRLTLGGPEALRDLRHPDPGTVPAT